MTYAVDRIPAPSISYGGIAPLIIVGGVACLAVLIEAFAPGAIRRRVQPAVAVVGFAAALAAVCALAGTHKTTVAESVAVDGPALFMSGSILVFGIISALLLAERSGDGGAIVADAAVAPGMRGSRAMEQSERVQTEVYPLLLFAVGGMMLFTSANSLLLMFVALEVLSLPLYLMCGLARRRRLLSQEAALKYFLLGAFSSAFFLYGVALVYGYAGTVKIPEIAAAVGNVQSNDMLLYIGLALLAVGLLFKIAAAPFQAWTPDVYQGAPTPVTGFMAAGTKIAAFGALLRVLYVAFDGLRWDWRPVIWGVAILTMVVGAVFALTQRDVKRLLAYSAIAHAGFILVGVAATNTDGLSGVMFYLLAYGFPTVGAFAVVTLVRDGDGEATDLARWAGLGKRSPVVAAVFSLFLLALIGIPLTSGFMGKYAVFSAAISGGATGLVIVGVVTSAITAFFYARVLVLMYFQEPATDGPRVAVPGGYATAVLALTAAATVFLGVFPQPIFALADSAALFVR